mmetsp:Transcript_33384/g.80069  ORF Transcript_33384/g.80069 Transcript_33384/m.80069 type:complete len:367 (+) Transcript_33384:60-1160(+)
MAETMQAGTCSLGTPLGCHHLYGPRNQLCSLCCLGLLLDKVQDALEALHLVVALKNQLLAVLRHLGSAGLVQGGDLGNGVRAAVGHGLPRGLVLHLARVEAEARGAVHDHLRHAVDPRGHARLLHGQGLQQRIRQTLQERGQRDAVAGLEHVERLLGEGVNGHRTGQIRVLGDGLLDVLLKFPLPDHQHVQIRHALGFQELLAGPQQHFLALDSHEAPDGAHYKLLGPVSHRRDGVSLLGLHGHFRGALELLRVRAVVDGPDQARADAEGVNDRLPRKLRDGHRAALSRVQQGPAIKLLFVGRIESARLGDQKCSQASIFDALPHETHILVLPTNLPNQRHADVRRLQDLRKRWLVTLRILGTLLV